LAQKVGTIARVNAAPLAVATDLIGAGALVDAGLPVAAAIAVPATTVGAATLSPTAEIASHTVGDALQRRLNASAVGAALAVDAGRRRPDRSTAALSVTIIGTACFAVEAGSATAATTLSGAQRIIAADSEHSDNENNVTHR
jgi:hypothetical protein